MNNMTPQSLLIKTAYSYRNELLSVFEDKHFLIPIGRYDKYPYLLITETKDLLFCEPVKEAKGKQVYYVHPRYFDTVRLIPAEAVIEFIKSIQT